LPSFYIYNQGTCTRLALFGEELRQILLLNGWVQNIAGKADYIFINSCSFIKLKENESLRTIRFFYNNKTHQQICVFGCLPATNSASISKMDKNIILFKRNFDEIARHFHLTKINADKHFTLNRPLSGYAKLIYWMNQLLFHSDAIKYRIKQDEVYHIQISYGCRGSCSYCSEKNTTNYYSRSIKEIICDFKHGLEDGYKLFALNSDDTSVFGWDKKTDIKKLLCYLIKIKGNYKIAITEFNPRGLFIPQITKFISDFKIIYITIPIQSGSQSVLQRMRRPYKIRPVMKKIEMLKNINPKLLINTHVIVGFPGESESDFQQTVKILKSGFFDRVKIFQYSDRPGTEAQAMNNKISSLVKKMRAHKLRTIVLIESLKRGNFASFLMNIKSII